MELYQRHPIQSSIYQNRKRNEYIRANQDRKTTNAETRVSDANESSKRPTQDENRKSGTKTKQKQNKTE
jgi:hypothetical protein